MTGTPYKSIISAALRDAWHKAPVLPTASGGSPQSHTEVVDYSWIDVAFPQGERAEVTGRPETWPPWCRHPSHRQGWKSIYGEHLICATCHPPVDEKIVAEWQTI